MSHISNNMYDLKKMSDYNNISDLETLYKILDIHVDNLPQKNTFSPEVANSKHDSIHFNTQPDAGLVKVEQPTQKEKKNIYTFFMEKYKDTQTPTTSASGGEDIPQWSKLTHLYIGSLTIIGLYAVFRAMQRS